MVNKRIRGWLITILVVLFIIVIIRTPTHPFYKWDPPAQPKMEGVLAPNKLLQKTEVLGKDGFLEAEDIVVDKAGNVYGSCVDGKIRRMDKAGKVSVFADTGGRPLGMGFGADGTLYVADSHKGLLSVDKAGKVTVIVDKVEGKKMLFTNNIDIAKDGTIYFSDASQLVTYGDNLRKDIISHYGTGRLFRIHPKTRKLKLLVKGLYFANGVALAQDESFVLVNETATYRVMRHWLKGPKAGKTEVFLKNLPGFPDNLRRGTRGDFWLPIISPRVKTADFLQRHPILKRLLFVLPDAFVPKPIKAGLVLRVSPQGKILKSYHDQEGKVMANITGVTEHNGYLYFGRIYNDNRGVGRYRLNDTPPTPRRENDASKASQTTPDTKAPADKAKTPAKAPPKDAKAPARTPPKDKAKDRTGKK